MPFYYGKSRDGSDMKEFKGMYINPDNPNEWSSMPYQKQVLESHIYDETIKYMNGRYSLDDVYKQIITKTTKGLSSRCKKFVLSHYDENGNFKQKVN